MTKKTWQDANEARWAAILETIHDLVDVADGEPVTGPEIERAWGVKPALQTRTTLRTMERRGLVVQTGRRNVIGTPMTWLPAHPRLRVVARAAYAGPPEPEPVNPQARSEPVTERNPVGSALVEWLCRLVDRDDPRVMREVEQR